MKTTARILGFFAAIVWFTASPWLLLAQGGPSGHLPSVVLNAEDLGPRSIEDLTSKSVPRDYAYAWQTMAQAMAQNRVDLLNGYFTGFAKERLTQRIQSQAKAGIHVRYIDRGHKLTGLFYSPAGDAMQLRDQAKLEIRILDGDKVIHSEQVTLQYMVLMTPGADRWLVRELQTGPEMKQ
jgi:hypothetical protein